MEPPWKGGKKVYINGLGHMTKMAAMPIIGKSLQNPSPTELIVKEASKHCTFLDITIETTGLVKE